MNLAVIRVTLHLGLTVQVQLLWINLATTQMFFCPRHQAELILRPMNLAVVGATLHLPLAVQVQLLWINLDHHQPRSSANYREMAR